MPLSCGACGKFMKLVWFAAAGDLSYPKSYWTCKCGCTTMVEHWGKEAQEVFPKLTRVK